MAPSFRRDTNRPTGRFALVPDADLLPIRDRFGWPDCADFAFVIQSPGMTVGVSSQQEAAIRLAEVADSRIGAVVVRATLLTLEHRGRSRELQPRVMQVLVALAQASPQVVSREQLIARCWEGRVVGDDALNRCIVVLRNASREFGGAFTVENVARVGYRVLPGRGGLNPQRLISLLVAGLFISGMVGALALLTERRTEPRQTRELFASARTMLGTGNPQVAGEARVKLEQALALAPRDAEGWAALAEAQLAEAGLRGPEAIVAALPGVRRNIARALALDPRSSAAHRMRAVIMGRESAAAAEEYRTSARLDPDSAEAQLGLAEARRGEGDFAGEIAAFRAAHRLEPAWYRPLRDLAVATAEMGDRTGALAIAAQIKQPMARCAGSPSRIAVIYGDLAAAARCSIRSLPTETIWQAPDRVRLASILWTLGLSRDWRSAQPIHLLDTRPPQGRVWMDAPPSPAQWLNQNRSPDAVLAYSLSNYMAAKFMLNSGRHGELAQAYLGATGLLGLRPASPLRASDLPAVPLAALALRRSGYASAALAMLAEARQTIETVYRRGPAPFTFDVDAAAVAAVTGEDDRAINLLQRARARGWVNDGWSDMRRLTDEPVFAGLRATSGFQAIDAGLDRTYSRERKLLVAGN